ncbi:MAG: hypothetical protein ACLGHC_07610 [Alphaproteobacteria bacterium]
MTDWFYSLPIWLGSIVVLGAALAVGLGGSLGVQKLLRLKVNAEEREVAINLMQVVAAYVGIMIAFAGVQVWQDFTDSRNAVSEEAATVSQLYQDLSIFGPETAPARAALRNYVVSVAEDEWPQLSQGSGSEETEIALQTVFKEIGKLNPADNRASAIYEEMLGQLNALVDFRHDRIVDSRNGIPAILWTIGLVGALLTIAYASAFTPTRYNVFMTAGIALTLGLVFLFILTVDYPYKGDFSVSSAPLTEVVGEFDRLDRMGMDAQGQTTELR